jgi:Fe-S cluster assembly protein SufD
MSEAILESLPHRRMEAWKWTDVRGQANDGLSGLSSSLTPKIDVPDGVSITLTSGGATDAPMAHVAARFTHEVLTLAVDAGVQISSPVTLSEMPKGHARIAVNIADGASLTLVEHHRGQGGGFANIDMNITLGKEAQLTRVIVQDDPEDMLRIAAGRVTQQDGSSYNQFTLSFGGALTRLETQLHVEGEGCEALMNGAYLLDGARHTDMTSHMQLTQPDSEIRQSVKGVVFDKARGVFQGKFHVERAAQKTDAEMRHDALLMSDRAEVRAKPELEIYADDVECAHGNTVGALDESALFYMRQRGIPLARAKSLLIEAFLVGVFDDLSDEELRGSLTEKVRTWLEAKL